jgi:two-component system chemotaxis response regulator CheB
VEVGERRNAIRKIRVMVVDDSAVMRKLIPAILERDPEIEVVATAMDGLFALNKIPKIRPDLITLDLDMPRMDGMAVLPRVAEEFKIPVLIVSSLSEKGAEMTLKALEAGAVDFVTKPREAISAHIGEIGEDLIQKVKVIAGISRKNIGPVDLKPAEIKDKTVYVPKDRSIDRIVAIGVSTGGPLALGQILPKIPTDFRAGIVIVQHMPKDFTRMFSNRLNQICRVEVKEACDGDMVCPGRILIAQGNTHLKVKRTNLGCIAVVSQGEPVCGHRPSVDVLFSSVADEFGPNAIGVLMTGMGEDGAGGIGKIKAAGGYTIAQDQRTSVVFGMPKIAIQAGHVEKVVPLEGIIPTLMEAVEQDRSGSAWNTGSTGLDGVNVYEGGGGL